MNNNFDPKSSYPNYRRYDNQRSSQSYDPRAASISPSNSSQRYEQLANNFNAPANHYHQEPYTYTPPLGQYEDSYQGFGIAPTKIKINPYAIASLIASLFGGCFITGILSVILGLKARREIAQDPQQGGAMIAMIGIIFGAFDILIFFVIVIFYIGVIIAGYNNN